MTVQEFIEQQKNALSQFHLFWEDGNKHCSDDFPSEMSKGDWDEQFAFFQDCL